MSARRSLLAAAAVAVLAMGALLLARLDAPEDAAAATTGAGAKPAPPAAFRRAAARLEMVVLYPTDTRGLKLAFARKVVDPFCPESRTESLRGLYTVRGSQTRLVELFEGRPRYCNGTTLWDVDGGTEVRLHGKRAVLVDLCTVRDCAFPEGAWGLEWCERGTTVQLVAEGVKRTRLLELARSMRPVDRAPARRCPPVGSA